MFYSMLAANCDCSSREWVRPKGNEWDSGKAPFIHLLYPFCSNVLSCNDYWIEPIYYHTRREMLVGRLCSWELHCHFYQTCQKHKVYCFSYSWTLKHWFSYWSNYMTCFLKVVHALQPGATFELNIELLQVAPTENWDWIDSWEELDNLTSLFLPCDPTASFSFLPFLGNETGSGERVSGLYSLLNTRMLRLPSLN